MLETNRRKTPNPLEENDAQDTNRSPLRRQAQYYYTDSESDIGVPPHRTHRARQDRRTRTPNMSRV